MVVRNRVCGPTQCGVTASTTRRTTGGRKPDVGWRMLGASLSRRRRGRRRFENQQRLIAVGTPVTERPPQSGRIEARTGLRMMPTFPRSPLSFRTAGFPQYGWKAGFPSGAFLDRQRLKPAPGMRRPTSSLHPPFVRLVVTTVVPHCVGPQTRLRTAVEDHYSSAPGALAQVRVIVSRSVIT